MTRNVRFFRSRGLLALHAAAALLCGAVRCGGQEFTLTQEQFNAWLSRGTDSLHGFTSAQLGVELQMARATARLADAQAAKLQLAGDCDVARFTGQVDELQQRFVGKSFPQQELGEVYREIQPLAQQLQQGLFGDASLYAKVLRQTLDPAQRQLYDEARRARRARSYAAAVRLLIAAIDQSAPLTERQREALLELVLRRTRPPRSAGTYDSFYACTQFATLDVQELAAVLDAAQLKVATKAQEQGLGWQAWLASMGVTPEP